MGDWERPARVRHTWTTTETVINTRQRAQQDGALAQPAPAEHGQPMPRHTRTAHRPRPASRLRNTGTTSQAATRPGTRHLRNRGDEGRHAAMTRHHPPTTNRCPLNEQDPDTLTAASAHLRRTDEVSRQRTHHIGILLDIRESMSSVMRRIDPRVTGYRRHVMGLIASSAVPPETDFSRSVDVSNRSLLRDVLVVAGC